MVCADALLMLLFLLLVVSFVVFAVAVFVIKLSLLSHVAVAVLLDAGCWLLLVHRDS